MVDGPEAGAVKTFFRPKDKLSYFMGEIDPRTLKVVTH